MKEYTMYLTQEELNLLTYIIGESSSWTIVSSECIDMYNVFKVFCGNNDMELLQCFAEKPDTYISVFS